jgi:hypothetical protein
MNGRHETDPPLASAPGTEAARDEAEDRVWREWAFVRRYAGAEASDEGPRLARKTAQDGGSWSVFT